MTELLNLLHDNTFVVFVLSTSGAASKQRTI